MNKGKGQSTRLLTIASRRKPNVNVFVMRYWPSTAYLNHEIGMQLTIVIACVLCRRSLIFKCYTMSIRQLN